MTKNLVILAAGKSSRMGHPKGLVEFEEQKLIDYQVKRFQKAGGKEVYIILGDHLNDYQSHFGSKQMNFSRDGMMFHLIKNDHLDWGPFYSLQLGLKACAGESLMTPVDSPLPSAQLILKIGSSKAQAAQPTINKRRGHPVFISNDLADKLIPLVAKESRLDFILKEVADIELIETDEEVILKNLNRPEDLKAEAHGKTKKATSKF